MLFVKVYSKYASNYGGEYCNACSDIGITLFARPPLWYYLNFNQGFREVSKALILVGFVNVAQIFI